MLSFSEANGSILFQNGAVRSLLANNREHRAGEERFTYKTALLQIASIDCDNNRAQDGALAAQDSQVKITGGEWKDNSSGNSGTSGCCGVGTAIYVQRSPLSLDGTNCHDNAAKTGACIFADSAEIKLNPAAAACLQRQLVGSDTSVAKSAIRRV